MENRETSKSQLFFRCEACSHLIPLEEDQEWEHIKKIGKNNTPVCEECYRIIQARIITRMDYQKVEVPK
jgi:uncharacterized Zn finger protein